MQLVKGNVPNFDTIALLKEENGLEEIIIFKVIDEYHKGNLALTCLDPCGNVPILYIVGTNGTWTHNLDDSLFVQMVLMLFHTSLFRVKS